MKDPVLITRFQESQARKLGQVLCSAFFDEPNFTYSLPSAAARKNALEWFFGVFLPRIGMQYGEIYTTETTDGGAIWMRPGSSVQFLGALRAGILAMPFRFGWAGFQRSTNLGNHLEQLRQQTAPKPHWYLMVLGVDPSKQGHGIGRALVQPVLSSAEQDGLPCYLETFTENNVRFYEKAGFTVLEHSQVPKGGPSFWTMVRPGRKASRD